MESKIEPGQSWLRRPASGAGDHGVRTEDTEEGGDLLDVPEGVLHIFFRERALEIDVEENCKTALWAQQRVLLPPRRPRAQGRPPGARLLPALASAPKRAALDLGEVDIPQGEGGERLEELPGPLAQSEHDRSLQALPRGGALR